MTEKRTDLAVEAKEIWHETAEETTQLKGVEALEEIIDGFVVETVRVLDEEGERNIGKPAGTYMTINISGMIKMGDGKFTQITSLIAAKIRELLDIEKCESIMVVGLGNSAITSDNLGPAAMEYLMVTRHLVEKYPEDFGMLRTVSALRPGVLALTGIESAVTIKAMTEEVKPDVLIVIDALASRKLSRVCRTIQLTNTGLTPGSGVGNSRAKISQESLGLPVIAIGVPTVVDAGTLAADLIEESGFGEISPEIFGDYGGGMMVTPKDIDAQIESVSRLIAYGINLALHDNLTEEDITMFV